MAPFVATSIAPAAASAIAIATAPSEVRAVAPRASNRTVLTLEPAKAVDVCLEIDVTSLAPQSKFRSPRRRRAATPSLASPCVNHHIERTRHDRHTDPQTHRRSLPAHCCRGRGYCRAVAPTVLLRDP